MPNAYGTNGILLFPKKVIKSRPNFLGLKSTEIPGAEQKGIIVMTRYYLPLTALWQPIAVPNVDPSKFSRLNI